MTAEQALSIINEAARDIIKIENFSDQYDYFRWLEKISSQYKDLDYIKEKRG